MKIDFTAIEAATFPGMNGGTGTMTARMYNFTEKCGVDFASIPTTSGGWELRGYGSHPGRRFCRQSKPVTQGPQDST